MLTVKMKLLKGARAPEYMTDGASAADLYATEGLVFAPGERKLVRTGVVIEIPAGYEGQVRSRSGLSLKHGIAVLNSPGTIDSDYRGELKVSLINLSKDTVALSRDTRIAQIAFTPVLRARFQERGSLSHTLRGSGGYGSTGFT